MRAMNARRIQGLLLVGLAAGVVLAAGLLGAAGSSLSFCAFRALLGLPCPFCGGIRASAALFEGGFREALSWNPAAVLGHAALLATGLILLLGRTPPWLAPGRQRAVFGAAALVLLGNWIYLIAAGR